jgi:hypothetical protein
MDILDDATKAPRIRNTRRAPRSGLIGGPRIFLSVSAEGIKDWGGECALIDGVQMGVTVWIWMMQGARYNIGGWWVVGSG